MRAQTAPPWTVRLRLYTAPHKVPAEWRQWAIDEIRSGRYRRNRPYLVVALTLVFPLIGVALDQPLVGLGALCGGLAALFLGRRANERLALEAVATGKSWMSPARPSWWPAVAAVVSIALIGVALYLRQR